MKSNNMKGINGAFKNIFQMREAGVLIPLIILAIVIGSINSVFFDYENIINVLRATSFLFITGIGMTIVLVSAGLDLSVGSQLALGSYFTASLLTGGYPIVVSIILGILAGVIVGIVNGAVIIKFRIPPFIATLGMLYMARGLVLITTRGVPIYPLPEKFNYIGQGTIFGVPFIVIIAIVLGIIANYILKNTTYGRAIYAVGGNEETARLSGINIEKIKMSVYIIVGGLATFTGLLQSARLGSAQPSIGQGFELRVIAAVIIGGTSLFGGAGTILGTFLGALFMSVMNNGMTLVRISPYWQQLVLGAIIVLAVALDQYRRRKRKQ